VGRSATGWGGTAVNVTMTCLFISETLGALHIERPSYYDDIPVTKI
jgi:hypothetical protein